MGPAVTTLGSSLGPVTAYLRPILVVTATGQG